MEWWRRLLWKSWTMVTARDVDVDRVQNNPVMQLMKT
jgi:hypothetical protein